MEVWGVNSGPIMLQCMSLLLAQSGHDDGLRQCPLLGVKRTGLPQKLRQLGDIRRDPPRLGAAAAHRRDHPPPLVALQAMS
jgi:hypothetical protein